MKHITFHLDFISPYAYLAFEHLPQALEGLSHSVTYRPVLLGALLKHHGQLGPAEIPSKRAWTYRQVLWQAQQQGVPLRFPPGHPFNPLAALRLCLAADATPASVDILFNWIWRDGHAADSAAALALPGAMLDVAHVAEAISAPDVKEQLRRNTDAAIAAGVFGVPTLSIDGELYWGNEAHALMQAVLADPGTVRGGEWDRVDTLPVAVQRSR